MSSLKFYIIFNILNILLIGFIILCMNTSMNLTFDLQGSPGSGIRFLWGFALYILPSKVNCKDWKKIYKINNKPVCGIFSKQPSK